MKAQSKRTKERILDAAEILFELHGIDATSTRQIAEAAQANSAAPNFHFSSKENLIKEVFRRRMQPLVERRLELLEQLLTGSQKPDVGAIYDSFVDPLNELRQSADQNQRAFLSLLARNTLAPRKEFTELLETELADYVDAYVNALSAALPHLALEQVQLRFDLSMAIIAKALNHPNDGAEKVARDYVLAGLKAD